jgi:hypothetical protein
MLRVSTFQQIEEPSGKKGLDEMHSQSGLLYVTAPFPCVVPVQQPCRRAAGDSAPQLHCFRFVTRCNVHLPTLNQQQRLQGFRDFRHAQTPIAIRSQADRLFRGKRSE